MNYKFEQPVVGEIGVQKYKITIQWRNGQFIADEPEKSGGGDLGPDPFTLLLSSLASCTLATLRMYIDKKGWDIPEIKVNVNMFQQTKNEKLLTTIDRDIHFGNDIPNEQKERLLEIAGNCPVSRLLQADVAIRTYVYHNEEVDKKLNYSNSEVTVEWRPDLCKHSGRCVHGLPGVFDVNKRPWINIEGATTEDIISQVNKCPTGALKHHKK